MPKSSRTLIAALALLLSIAFAISPFFVPSFSGFDPNQFPIPQDNPLRDVNEAKPRPKIAVVITYLPDADNRPPIAVKDVQNFVQASLPEVRPEDVSAMLIPFKDATQSGPSTSSGDPSGPSVAANDPMYCKKDGVIGIDVCTGQKKKVINGVIILLAIASILAVMAVVAVFRALRYRKDLTRLTAQVQQLRK